MENLITCPICLKSGAFREHISKCQFNSTEIRRHECSFCGVVFGTKQMIEMPLCQIKDEYRKLYETYHEGNTTRFEMASFMLVNPSTTGRYLNYGAGKWSQSINQLRDRGFDIVGYEPFCPPTGPTAISAMDPAGAFDAIISHNLIEHLQDPVNDFRRMRGMLSLGGKMAHSTACYDYRHHETRFHLFFFTGESIQVLAKRSGLKFSQRVDYPDYSCCVFERNND